VNGLPSWAVWAEGEPYTLGAEEEVMLLNPHDWSLAQQVDRVLPRLSQERRSCSFAPRCAWRFGACLEAQPEPFEVGPDHRTRCFAHAPAARAARIRELAG